MEDLGNDNIIISECTVQGDNFIARSVLKDLFVNRLTASKTDGITISSGIMFFNTRKVTLDDEKCITEKFGQEIYEKLKDFMSG